MYSLKKIIFLFLLAVTQIHAQGPSYAFKIEKSENICVKADAKLIITGPQAADSVKVTWSTGATNTLQITQLAGGFYSVQVKITHRQDTSINNKDTTLVFVKDTLIPFAIIKEECGVSIGKYFSPNGDGYADALSIGNIDKYPNFELSIYNRWGQRVHHQQSKYTPWDGTWLGVDLPDGAYYYVFFYDAADHKYLVKGDVSILR